MLTIKIFFSKQLKCLPVIIQSLIYEPKKYSFVYLINTYQ